MARVVSADSLLAARRSERERLAHSLHDDVCGGLTAAGLSLDLLAMDLQPEHAARVRDIQALLENAFESVRALTMEFHPDPAVRFRLIPALEALASRFEKRFTRQLHCQLSEAAASDMNPARARACYAVAEAALENVLNHAQATEAWLVLEGESTVFGLTIRDNGKGFEKSTALHGTGTAVMEYHVRVAELILLIQSEAGGGTRVMVTSVDRVNKQKKRGSHADGD